jgi:hypothetical protein
MRNTHSVIWNKTTDKLDIYKNGIWNGRAYTQATLLVSINPYSLGAKLPQIYAEIRHIERHGMKAGILSRRAA